MKAEENYIKNLKDLEFLYKEGFKLSAITSDREVASWKEEYASYILAKIVLNARAILKLLPGSSLNLEAESFQFWDISSVSTLARALIETYLVFYYLIIEKIPNVESDFRYLLWCYNSEKERLKMLELIRSKSSNLANLKEKIASLWGKIEANRFFQSLDEHTRKELRRGYKGIFLENHKIAIKAGINENYYRAVYKYLSNYVHTLAFSVSQLSKFEAATEDSLNLLDTVVEYCILYLSFSIRDFSYIFPDIKDKINGKTWDIINNWEDIVKSIFKQS